MSPPVRWPELILALCASVAGLGASGCSVLFVDGPPAAHASMVDFGCTSSNTAPGIDTTLAVLTGIEGAALFVAANQSTYADGSSGSSATVVGALAESALFGASALYGFSKTSSCREARAQLAERSLRSPPGFGAPVAPPPGFAPPLPGYAQPYDPWMGAPAAAPPPVPPDLPPPGPADAAAPGAPAKTVTPAETQATPSR